MNTRISNYGVLNTYFLHTVTVTAGFIDNILNISPIPSISRSPLFSMSFGVTNVVFYDFSHKHPKLCTAT